MMRKIGIGLLACFALLCGCEKREAFRLKENVLEINLNSEVDEEVIRTLIDCEKHCEAIQIDSSMVVSNKVGEYPVKISLGNYSDQLILKVKDNIPPKIFVEEFAMLVNQNIIWNRELFEELNMKVSDNITSINELYKNISVSGIDTGELGWQQVTFTVRDEGGNFASCEVWVEIVEEKEVITEDEEVEIEEEAEDEEQQELIELPQMQYDEEGNAQICYDISASEFLEFLKHEKESFILLISQNRSEPCKAMEEKLKSYFEKHTPLMIYRINLSTETYHMVVENESRRYKPTAFYQLLDDLELPFVGTPAVYLLKDGKCRANLVGDEGNDRIDAFMQKAYDFSGIVDEYVEGQDEA